MQSNLVTFVDDHTAFFGKCFEGMTWDEPGCFHVIFVEKLKKATDTD